MRSSSPQPLVPVMATRNRALAFGRPHPSGDRLQADAVFVRGPDLDCLVRVLGRFLRDYRGQPFQRAALSSGVAVWGWRGRRFCPDQPIAFRASQPRCRATRVSPHSEAITAATFGLLHRVISTYSSSFILI